MGREGLWIQVAFLYQRGVFNLKGVRCPIYTGGYRGYAFAELVRPGAGMEKAR